MDQPGGAGTRFESRPSVITSAPVRVSTLPRSKSDSKASNLRSEDAQFPGLDGSRKFNFDKWMAEKDELARSSLEFHNRFGLAQDFEVTPPYPNQFGGWNPIL